MLPDVFIPSNTWIDVYELTGISAGTALKVTNKSPAHAYAWEGDSAPPSSPDIKQGEPIPPGGSVRNTDLSIGLWLMYWSPNTPPLPVGGGRFSVQEWLE